MTWDVEYTEAFEDWWVTLTEEQQEAVAVRVELLAERGPSLGRPTVGEIDNPDLHHLKELIVSKGGALRILFAFNPLSTAILLVGGDKSDDWKGWYREAIPQAIRLYDEHIAELRDEGSLP